MNTVLNIDSKILAALEFFRGHELDAHSFGAIRNAFLELEIARLRNGFVAETLQHLSEL